MPVLLSSLLVVSSSQVLSTLSRSSLSNDLILAIFSDEVISHSPTKNLRLLICQFFPNRLSRGSLWNLEVNTKSYPSPSKSSMSNVRQRRVLTSAKLVCAINVNLLQFEIFSVCYAWTHSAITLRNDGFWSQQLFLFNTILEFHKTHYLLNNFRKSTVLLSSEK